MTPPLSWRTQSVRAWRSCTAEGARGQGGQQAWCFLSAGGLAGLRGRLEVMTETTDGFQGGRGGPHETAAPAKSWACARSGVMDMHVMRYLRDVKLLADVDRAVREVSENTGLEEERIQLMAAAKEKFEKKMEGIIFNNGLALPDSHL